MPYLADSPSSVVVKLYDRKSFIEEKEQGCFFSTALFFDRTTIELAIDGSCPF